MSFVLLTGVWLEVSCTQAHLKHQVSNPFAVYINAFVAVSAVFNDKQSVAENVRLLRERIDSACMFKVSFLSSF
jgi:uncharacterized membrane protein